MTTGTDCDPRILDAAHLARQTFGDRALEREVLSLFEEQCGRLFPILAEPGGAPGRADAAHTLKGAARAVGAWRVAERAEALEETVRDPCGTAAAKALAELRRAIAEARDAIGERRRASA
jgi:HPt (histidine-containing phosphotransfer) domain-containing protein